VRYTHPNTLLISWQHWVPSYVRTELKKKTGIVIDEYGKQVEDESTSNTNENKPKSLEEKMFKLKDPNSSNNKIQIHKKFTPITSYKPQGNLIYNEDLLNTMGEKFA